MKRWSHFVAMLVCINYHKIYHWAQWQIFEIFMQTSMATITFSWLPFEMCPKKNTLKLLCHVSEGRKMSVRFFFSSTLLANFFYNFFPFTCQAGWCRVFPVTLKRHRDTVNKCRNLLWTTEIQNEETVHLESKLGRGDWPRNKSRLRCQERVTICKNLWSLYSESTLLELG